MVANAKTIIPRMCEDQADLSHPGVGQAVLQKSQAQQTGEVWELLSCGTVADQPRVPAEGCTQLIEGQDVLGPRCTVIITKMALSTGAKCFLDFSRAWVT